MIFNTITTDTACIGIRLSNNRCILLDCGESTQHTLIRTRGNSCVSIGKIDMILLTHLHGDHCFGIFGLLATIGSLNARSAPLIMYSVYYVGVTVFIVRSTNYTINYCNSYMRIVLLHMS